MRKIKTQQQHPGQHSKRSIRPSHASAIQHDMNGREMQGFNSAMLAFLRAIKIFQTFDRTTKSFLFAVIIIALMGAIAVLIVVATCPGASLALIAFANAVLAFINGRMGSVVHKAITK